MVASAWEWFVVPLFPPFSGVRESSDVRGMGVSSTMNAELHRTKKLLVTIFGSDAEVAEWVPNYCVTFSTLTPSVDAGSMAFIALIAVVAVLMSASCIRALRSGSAALAAGPIWQSA